MRTRTITVHRRHLPHWTTEEGTYFVTFRQADAISRHLAERIAHRRYAHRLLDRFLDRGGGTCYLRRPEIAKIVDDALRFFDGERYVLHASTIMPNHAHVVFRTMPGITYSSVMKSWKGFTARRINEVLGRRGRFWQDESYDSLIHDQRQLHRTIEYVARNPIRAGLQNWPWTRILNTQFRFRENDTV